MPKIEGSEVQQVYAMAHAFVDAALRNDGSLFTPERSVISETNLEDLHARFVEHPDSSSRAFEDKLRDQLDGAGPETIQLAAELLYVHFLIARNIHGATKGGVIDRVLAWSPVSPSIPEPLAQVLDKGIANVGTAFNTMRPNQLAFLIEFLLSWKRLPAETRESALEDAWKFRDVLYSVPIKGAFTQREALLHLVFPDVFEPIVSQNAKQRITDRFRDCVTDQALDVDQKLVEIRRALEPQYGPTFQFYDPAVKPHWQPDETPWGRFIYWAERFVSWDGFDASERDYKLVLAERLDRARTAVLSDGTDWIGPLKQAFGSPNNLTSWRDHDRFLKWCVADPAAARASLQALWDRNAALDERIRGFEKLLPKGTVSMATAFMSYLLMADPLENPVFRMTPFVKGFMLTDEPGFPPNADPASYYAHAVGFLDRILEEAEKRGVELRDRLDAQSVLWGVTRWRSTDEPVSTWSSADRRAYLKFRGDPVNDSDPDTDAATTTTQGTWIFQASPKHFDATGAVAALAELNWTIRQHLNLVKRGDMVYIWEAGVQAGIVAQATIITDPGPLPDDPAEDAYNREPQANAQQYPLVRLRIARAYPERIFRQDLLQHPVLKDLGIIKMAQQTNYPLTLEQADALRGLIAGSGIPPHLPPSGLQRSFAELMQYLESEGLHFPEELVANYLLALQTKRFVILSGISGTGKTQLALAVARYFQPTVRAAAPPNLSSAAVEMEVKPWVARYRQLLLPAAVRAVLRVPAFEEGKLRAQIEVEYPNGKATLSLGQYGQNSMRLVFSGAFKDWFQSHMHEGDRYFLEVLPADAPEETDRLRLTLRTGPIREAFLQNIGVVAVRPDWTDHRGLLGFFNPLTEHYTVTPFLRLVLDAQADCDRARTEKRPPHPFFAILDEMNLARVEHYFSDFLSALESREPLDLHQSLVVEVGEDDDGIAVPRRLAIPTNLFFTGTVNIDETTYMFSPKVLDRAFTLELNQVDLAGYRDTVALTEDEPSSSFALIGLPPALQFERAPGGEDWDAFKALDAGSVHAVLLDLHDMLAVEHRHFGYRVANEIARFVTLAAEQARDTPEVIWRALDLAILQKVLPKFHGTQQEIGRALQSLFQFAVDGQTSESNLTDPKHWLGSGDVIMRRAPGADLNPPRLPRTATKVWRMLGQLERQGFTSFIE